jgi:hypothetical protein
MDGSKVHELAVRLEAVGSRVENEQGESTAFEIIKSTLSKAGLPFVESDFSDARDGYSRSRIIETTIKAATSDELAVIVPVNSWIDAPKPYEGAYGIAAALDAALRLAEKAKTSKPNSISIRFVFLGAERRGKRSSGETASLGSKTWIERWYRSDSLAVLYLSLDYKPEKLIVRNAGRTVLSPFWYYETVRHSLESSGLAFDLEANQMQLFRLGLADEYGPAATYLEAGIPAIELVASQNGTSFADDDWLFPFLEEFSKTQSQGFPDSWDRHYFILQLGTINLVVRETPYAVFLIAFTLVVSISILILTITRRNATKLLLRRGPVVAVQLVVLYAALVAAFLAGTGCSRIVAELLGSNDAWRLAPRWAVSARFASAFLIFLALLSISVEQRILTPNPFFYEFAALTVLAFDILIFAAIDLSVTFYFVWAFIIVQISLTLRRRWTTLAAYILMYAPLSVIIVQLIQRPQMEAFARIVSPDFGGVLILSALLLPLFVFTASPLLFFAKPGATARRRAAVIFIFIALMAEAAAAFAAATSPIVVNGLRTDLSAREFIDQDAQSFEALLKGKRRLGSGLVYRGGNPVAYKIERDEIRVVGKDVKKRIAVVGQRSLFLERQQQRISIGFSEKPYEVVLTLESEKLFIYDCSLPYDISLDGKKATIYAGVNPGSSLSFSITVPEEFEAKLVVSARYLRPIEEYSLPTGETPADFETVVRASFDLSGWK